MYKKLIEGKKAVIFDMDGTLIDSEPLWEEAFTKVAETVGISWEKVKLQVAGIPVIEKWKRILEDTEAKDNSNVEALAQQTHDEFLKLVKEKDLGVKDGFWGLGTELKIKKGFKLGLSTNTHRYVTDKVLDHLGIRNVFDFTICGNEVKKRKPNPEMYKTAAKNLGVKSKEVLVFEDSVTGATASSKAGMDTIIIWDGTIAESEYPKGMLGFLPDFTALPGNLDTTLKEELDAKVERIKKLQEK